MEHDSFETPMRPADPLNLRHVLASTEDAHRSERRGGYDSPAQSLRERQRAGIESQTRRDGRNEASSPNNDDATQHTTTASTTRRNPTGSVSSVYAGNKIRYLKKDDGEPLWRKDIQFAFLRLVFEDTRKVFTKASDGTSGHTFAEIYTDAMAKSSKCSGILKEKLLNDHGAAINMAMICLLVNVGRMNTTLNFFPEMRARVRTYHSIPCLQAHQSSQQYKQLQDGPRLKSILKGATEDVGQPSTVEDIMRQSKPRTNPVNLIFVLSQYAPKISEMHFLPPRDFFDLFTRSTLSSKTRADAFLWLIWWYLESDFSTEASQANPFGRGTAGSESTKPIMVPRLDVLTDDEANAENVDTEEERAFGVAKRLERRAIVASDPPAGSSAAKRGHKTAATERETNYRTRGSPYGGTSASDSEGDTRHRSGSPAHRRKRQRDELHQGEAATRLGSSPPRLAPRPGPGVRIDALLNDEPSKTPSAQMSSFSLRKSTGRGSWPKKRVASPGLESSLPQSSTPYRPRPLKIPAHSHPFAADPNMAHISPSGVYSPSNNGPHPGYFMSTLSDVHAPSSALATDKSGRRNRGPTQHQREVVNERQRRATFLLEKSVYEIQKEKRRERKRRGVVIDAWIKCNSLPPNWNSDEDERGRLGGIDEVRTDDEDNGDDLYDDVGERRSTFARAFGKIARALNGETPIGIKKRTYKRPVFEPSPVYDAPEPLKPLVSSRRSRPSAATNLDSLPHPDDTATPPPAASKAKRVYRPRRPPGSAPRATGPGSRGGKPRVRGATARTRKVADVGIPVDEFLATATPPLKRSELHGRHGEDTPMGDADDDEDEQSRVHHDVGEEEIDDFDRELLNDAADAEDDTEIVNGHVHNEGTESVSSDEEGDAGKGGVGKRQVEEVNGNGDDLSDEDVGSEVDGTPMAR